MAQGTAADSQVSAQFRLGWKHMGRRKFALDDGLEEKSSDLQVQKLVIDVLNHHTSYISSADANALYEAAGPTSIVQKISNRERGRAGVRGSVPAIGEHEHQ